MGLHRDGLAYGMNAVELHVRRMVWHQICMLDIRTCEAHGPQPGIREGDFDTRFPLNLNDEDLAQSPPPDRDADHWTDMTCTLIRMECIEMHRHVWAERPRIEKKQASLTALISKIQDFRRNMEERYFPMMDLTKPVHRAARYMLIILTMRLHTMVLHRYHNSTSSKYPERLRQIIRGTGLDSVEAAMYYETEPQLAPFRWYAGALQQYQAAFLLLTDVAAYPNNSEAERVWNIVDYVFEPPLHLTRRQKSILIVTEIRDRLEVYHAARKTRVPVGMQKRFNNLVPGTKELVYLGHGGPVTRRETTGSPETISDVTAIDPDGEAHVSAILSTMGLAGASPGAGMDWDKASFAIPQPQESPQMPVNETGSGGNGSWQDFGEKADVPLFRSAPTVSPSLSDELMAEIDWVSCALGSCGIDVDFLDLVGMGQAVSSSLDKHAAI